MTRNNYSIEHQSFIKRKKKTSLFVFISQLALLVLIILLWEVLAQLNVLNTIFTSSPSRIANAIYNLMLEGNLFYHIGITLSEAVIGFILASFLGYVFALLLWSNEYLRRILEPYIVVLNSLPKIALGPLIIIWFGVGIKSIIVMDFLILIIVTTLSLLSSFLNVDKEKVFLLQSFKASKLQLLTKLVIPSTIKDFISVLKINVGLTWVGTIMGEYLVSKAGLGYLIVYGGAVFKLDLVMASTIILCLLATLMYLIVLSIEFFYNKKHQK